MGVSVESREQYDLPQAPPCLDGNCSSAGSPTDQREGGGGRGDPVSGSGHSAGSCFTWILLFFCLSPSNLSSQHFCLHSHRSDQVCLGPLCLLRHLLCRLPAPALHRRSRGRGLEGLQPTCLKAAGLLLQSCGGAKLRASQV